MNIPKKDVQSVRIHWTGATSNHGEALRLVKAPGDVALVERGRPRSLVCMCPCGCGTAITLNLDRRADKAWMLYRTRRGYSLYPSVWRDSGCQSHFVIWDNRILWFDEDWWFEDEDFGELSERIFPLVPLNTFIHFRKLAEHVEEVPWSVLRACKNMVRQGRLVEGKNKLREHFRRVQSAHP